MEITDRHDRRSLVMDDRDDRDDRDDHMETRLQEPNDFNFPAWDECNYKIVVFLKLFY